MDLPVSPDAPTTITFILAENRSCKPIGCPASRFGGLLTREGAPQAIFISCRVPRDAAPLDLLPGASGVLSDHLTGET